ncbi:molybdopterin-guanine dinucleotide biosynthesis protein MobB [Thiohalomonas denitrificans]|uniref:Molybdopterin-guanine dinucleotide biosynthesis protein B n=1 Tax=Thiohalomonas denitrificans TaxID=415747 RepID=A0A1G5PK39_9GAMM|nr:molybdopterin-guanine dinucleotide biosynthesis protein MobB [Thiohalomonas denitrificans]SCZ49877.1 molybdopterin-guanine dinucleotide biosynthesis protein B [Thiohalomonas denitrificans]
MKDLSPTPVLGFIAFSGTGKTTLLEQLIPLLRKRGLEVALIKHAHHDFDIDIPGKDSYRLRKAGASQTLVASRKRWALISEHGELPEPDLDSLLRQLDHDRLDLILVEGFKHEAFPKIEIRRESLGKPRLYPDDDAIIAVATDRPAAIATTRSLSVLDLNQPDAITDFVHQWVISSGEA